MKEVSKITGETTLTVRKINNPGNRKLKANNENNQIDSRSNAKIGKNKHDD